MSNRVGMGALLVLAVVVSAAQNGAPSVAGVRLGMSVAQARDAVGKAERESASLGMQFWEYSRRGITLIWKEGERGVQGIVVNRGDAGDVGGVRVGDAAKALTEHWGTPARLRQEGRYVDFFGARWVLSAEVRDGMVVEITLMAAGSASH